MFEWVTAHRPVRLSACRKAGSDSEILESLNPSHACFSTPFAPGTTSHSKVVAYTKEHSQLSRRLTAVKMIIPIRCFSCGKVRRDRSANLMLLRANAIDR